MTFLYVDIPASIFFSGAMKSVTTNYTVLSVSLPVIGVHSVTVSFTFVVSWVRAKPELSFEIHGVGQEEFQSVHIWKS